MSLTTRILTPEDAAAWRDLRIEGCRLFPLAFLPTEAEARAITPDQAAAMMAGGAYLGLFAERLIGFSGLRQGTLERTRHNGDLGPFYVTPAHHASGAAAALMEATVAHAKAKGITRLELHVDTGNPRAIAFYRRHGFSEAARITGAVQVDGEDRTDLLMERRLSEKVRTEHTPYPQP
ncbi:MAG: GNAT family N-acetyltransferase [Shimia sp.]